MKAHVSTMLTESGLSIPLPVRHFKARVRRKAGCKPTSKAFRVLFVLTMWVVASGLQTRNAGHVARRSHRQGIANNVLPVVLLLRRKVLSFS